MGGSGIKRITGKRWQRIRHAVLQKGHYRCRKCGGRRQLQVDHIKPLAKGGAESFRNYQVLCKVCHDIKTAGENAIPGRAEWIERVRVNDG